MATDSELLTAIDTAISNHLAGNAVNYYMIGGKQVRYNSLKELMEIRSILKSRINSATGETRNLARFAR